MFKSMKSIFFLIIIAVTLIMFFVLMIYNTTRTLTNNTKYSKDVNIYQIDEGYLQITENIIVNISDTNVSYLSFPISIHKEYDDGDVDLIDTKVMIDNNEILEKYESERLERKEELYGVNNEVFQNVNRDITFFHSSNYISLSTKNKIKFEQGKHIITLSYKCNINDIITNYNNIAILKVKRNTQFEELNVTISIPSQSSTFKVNSNKAVIEKIDSSTYKANLSDVKILDKFEYVGFTFENDTFSSAKRVYENYDITKETGIFANEEVSNKVYLFVLAISTVILFIITIVSTKKVKLKRNYIRDTKSVISPILAESLIDRKMRFKRAYNDMYC